MLFRSRPGVSASSSLSNGYFAGGSSGNTNISRLNFSNETASLLTNALSQATFDFDGTSARESIFKGRDAKTYGYTFGYDGPLNSSSIISRVSFSTDVVSDLTNNLPTSVARSSAVSTNSYGYIAGGVQKSPPADYSGIMRFDFFGEYASDMPAVLPTTLADQATISNNSYGYFVGGIDTSLTPQAESGYTIRLEFYNETIRLTPKVLLTPVGPPARTNMGGVSSNSYGYIAGGSDFAPLTGTNTYNTINRLDFSTETYSLPGKNLPADRYQFATTSNNSYGYFGGNRVSSSTISRIDFSNETNSLPGKNLTTPTRWQLAAASSGSSGYFIGGTGLSPLPSPVIFCTIDRLDFSTETCSNPGNYLTSAKPSFAALSNSN